MEIKQLPLTKLTRDQNGLMLDQVRHNQLLNKVDEKIRDIFSSLLVDYPLQEIQLAIYDLTGLTASEYRVVHTIATRKANELATKNGGKGLPRE